MSQTKQAASVAALTVIAIGTILYGPSWRSATQAVGLAPSEARTAELRAGLARTLPAVLLALKKVDLGQLPKGTARCDASAAPLPTVVLDERLVQIQSDANGRITDTWEGLPYRSDDAQRLIRAGAAGAVDRGVEKTLEAFLATPRVALLVAERYQPARVEEHQSFTGGALDGTVYVIDLAASSALCWAPVHAQSSEKVAINRTTYSRERFQDTLDEDLRRHTMAAVQDALGKMVAPGRGDAAAPLPLLPPPAPPPPSLIDALVNAKVVTVEPKAAKGARTVASVKKRKVQ